jgi:DNA-binding transcriptional regulator YiaG
MSDIHNDVRYNLGKYAHLTADEEEAWNAIISGDKQFSELGGSDAEAKKRLQRAYLNAERKASEIEQDRMANYYGVSRSYRNVREMAQDNTPWKPELQSAKDGAKITVAKIRERTKDADRFHKTTKDKQDRNEKAIARADKKMYSRRDFIKRGKK